MKKSLLLIILFLFSKSFSQQAYNAIYNYKVVNKKYGNHTIEVKTSLAGNGKISIYEEFFTQKKSNDTDNNVSLKSVENPLYYKNLSKKTVTYKQPIVMKNFQVKDSISGFDWKITAEKKNILGYSCQKATLLFRGRNYVAYFTDKISIQDGPWKFFGLPGMILEVSSNDTDMSISIIAEKLELKKEVSKFENPYQDNKSISYNEFLKIYNKKHKEMVSNELQNPGAFVIPKGYQEVYVTD